MRSTVLFLVLSCLYNCQGNPPGLRTPEDSPSAGSQVSLQGTGVQDGSKPLVINKDEFHNASQKAPSSKKTKQVVIQNSPAKNDNKTVIKLDNETKLLNSLGKKMNLSEKPMMNETETLVPAVKTNKTVSKQISGNQLQTHDNTLKTEEVIPGDDLQSVVMAGNKTDKPKPDNRREKLKKGQQPGPKSISDQEKENTANAEQQRPESKEKTTENETPGENEGNNGNEEEVMNSADKRGGQASPPSQPQEESSHFFAYFIFMALLVATLYVGYHNKRKIIAFVLEGRRSRAPRRPKSSDYQKLDQH